MLDVTESWDSTLRDIYRVGPKKPLGYLVEAQILENGSTLENIKEWATQQGLATMQFPKGARGHTSTPLYVYDPVSLQVLLNANSQELIKVGWPTEPEAYVSKVATVDAEPGTELYRIIAASFADYANPYLITKWIGSS